jgi:ATP-binding cassette subfamily B protein
MKELLKYLWKWKFKIFLGVLALFIVDLSQLFVPLVIRSAIDKLIEEIMNLKILFIHFLIIIFLALLTAFFRYFWRYFIMGSAREIEKEIREKLYRHLLNLDFYFYQRKKVGDIMAHSTNDLEAIRMALGMGIVGAADFLIMFFFSLFFMLKISPSLTLYVLIPLPILSIIMLFFGSKIHHLFRKVQEGFSYLSEIAQEAFSGIKVIKAFVKEKEEEKIFYKGNELFFKRNMNLAYLWGAFMPLITLISGISIVLLIFIGGKKVILNEISLGSFVAFVSYIEFMIWPMMAIGWIINVFQRGAASMDRINDLLREKRVVKNVPNPIKIKKLKGKIEVKNLSFYYPNEEKPVLKNISFKINPGEKIGILGKIGSGKTTLANLFLRIIEPPDNTIFIDEIDIKKYDLEDLRREIFLLPQEAVIFSGKIKENIAFTNPYAKEDEIIKAAISAHIYDEINLFPNKFDTIVGERGITLSGGQRQRIALSRAFLLNPSIFILDDALSQVDSETEEKIINNLKEYLRDKTTIIISYRTSVLKNLDRIIVLVDGEIEDIGTHEELIKKDGFYKKVYEIQSALIEITK